MCWLTCWLTAQPTLKVKKNNQLVMRACDEKGAGGKVMAMGIRVAGDEEGEGGKAGDGVGNCHRPWYWREIYPDYGASC